MLLGRSAIETQGVLLCPCDSLEACVLAPCSGILTVSGLAFRTFLMSNASSLSA